jgi:hypothetical protein
MATMEWGASDASILVVCSVPCVHDGIRPSECAFHSRLSLWGLKDRLADARIETFVKKRDTTVQQNFPLILLVPASAFAFFFLVQMIGGHYTIGACVVFAAFLTITGGVWFIIQRGAIR